MINLWSNFLSDGATVTASSSATGFPASNVQNDQPTTVWINSGLLTTDTLTFDFGYPVTITDFIMAFVTLGGQLDNFKLMANTSDSWGSPAFSQNLTWAPGVPIHASFASQTYQFWQITFDVKTYLYDDFGNQIFDDMGNPIYDDSGNNQVQIGRVYLGTASTVNPPDFQAGVKCIRQDLSLVNTARSGADYGILKASKRFIDITWTNAIDSDKTTMDAIYNLGGKVLKFFIQVDSSSGDPDISAIIYVRFFGDPQSMQVGALDTTQCWDMEYGFLEQI